MEAMEVNHVDADAGCPARDEQRGYSIQTYTGLRYYPDDPHEDEIDIESIAHSLSMQCRYNGHCQLFYSTAQHSVLMVDLVDQEFKLEALLHDAAEAIVGDFPRPLKRILPSFSVLEQKNYRVIANKFGIPENMSPQVKHADDLMLATERVHLMKNIFSWGSLPEPLPWKTLHVWSPEEAKMSFLNTFYNLTQG